MTDHHKANWQSLKRMKAGCENLPLDYAKLKGPAIEARFNEYLPRSGAPEATIYITARPARIETTVFIEGEEYRVDYDGDSEAVFDGLIDLPKDFLWAAYHDAMEIREAA